MKPNGGKRGSIGANGTGSTNGAIVHDILNAVPSPDVFTTDFVIRSLRRRLWKAFQEDDVETALRAYQASLDDFEQWLRQEEEERQRIAEIAAVEAASSNKEKRGSFFLKRMSSKSRLTRSSSADRVNDRINGKRPARKKLTAKAAAAAASKAEVSDGNGTYKSFASETFTGAPASIAASTDLKQLVGSVLQNHMNPSEPFIADDFLSPYDAYDKPAQKTLPDPQRREREQLAKKRRSSRKPRLAAFNVFRKSDDAPMPEIRDELESAPVVKEDTTTTTPLHEAARLGAGDFIRVLLANGGDPNAKNGHARTALHMCAGGHSSEEDRLTKAMAKSATRKTRKSEEKQSVGVSAPSIPPDVFALMYEDPTIPKQKSTARKAAKAMGRMFNSAIRTPKEKPVAEQKKLKSSLKTKADPDRLNHIVTERMDAMLALLSWINHETQDGPSLNAVDADGRSALHYAAEMGRTDVCMAILSNFGAMLTIVDELGARTPCELAAAQGHYQLAAQLEARAVLYIDPYGLDDELMASVLTGADNGSLSDPRRNLVQPFKWFETLSPEHIAAERVKRLTNAHEKMKKIVHQWDTSRDIKSIMASAEKIGLTAALDDDLAGGDDVATTATAATTTASSVTTDESSETTNGSDKKKSSIAALMSSAEKVGLEAAVAHHNGSKGVAKKRSGDGDGDSDGDGYGDADDNDDDGHNDDDELDSKPAAAEKVPTKKDDTPESKDKVAATASKQKESTGKKESPVSTTATKTKKDEVDDDAPENDARTGFLSMQESHVEKYLSYHKWNVHDAVKAFRKSPEDAFSKAKIPVPKPSPTNGTANEQEMSSSNSQRMCLICYDDEVEEDSWVKLNGCVHGFCKDCMVDYLKDCAASKMPVVSITCPHHECDCPMSASDIQSVVLKDHAEAYQRIAEANNEYFISSAYDFRFCPHPGCTGVVQRATPSFLASNNIDQSILDYTGACCTAAHPITPEEKESPIVKIGDFCTLTYDGMEDLEYNNCHSRQQPRRAHRFCFSCGESIHWPVTCERLEEWRTKVREQVSEVDDDDDDENDKNDDNADGSSTRSNNNGNDDDDDDNNNSSYHRANDVAQKLWIKANTRPCPQCNVPIEKNDGCNHMTCTNPSCRHEFCWICRKDWKLHGTATGGFFRCNIWQEEGEENNDPNASRPGTANTAAANGTGAAAAAAAAAGEGTGDPNDPNDQAYQGYGTAIHSAREAYKRRQEMGRFLHHYTRWEAHCQSARLERKMGDTVYHRLAPVVEAAMDFNGSPTFNFGGKGLSFVHSAFTELLECRSVLKHSYAFSFFRYPAFYQFRRIGQLNSRRREKAHFESIQAELEMMTEQMSDVVARAHLRATQIQITYLTANAAEKREEFSNLMLSILNDELKEARHAARSRDSSDRNSSSSSSSASGSGTSSSSSSRRYRHVNIPSPFGSLGRVLEDSSWPNDTGLFHNPHHDDGIRASLADFLPRAIALEAGGAGGGAALGRGNGMTGTAMMTMMDPHRGHNAGDRMWACSACTYMNTDGGDRCAMCGGWRR